MKIQIELDEKELRKLVHERLCQVVGIELSPDDYIIEVKSKQNYKSEWEQASFRARLDKFIDLKKGS